MKGYAPATERNRVPILEVLTRVLPREGLVLEIASGTGEHAGFFARSLPHLAWQPSDISDAGLSSIAAWRTQSGAPNLRAPLRIDVTEAAWGVEAADAIVCINMIHIAPWAACEGLMRGASRLLREGGVLYLYGPFRFEGAFLAPSNEVFDASLRGRDPSFGVRDLGEVTQLAAGLGLARQEVVAMPANNHSIIFRKESSKL